MTQQPEPVYGVTESELNGIYYGANEVARKIYRDVTARGTIKQQAGEPDIGLIGLAAINNRLRMLYPDDFALQLNEEQLKQQQAEHDAAIRAEEREKVLDEIQDHNDGRLEGMEDLFATPAKDRAESAQDVYMKEAYFELTLVKHLIDSLRNSKQEAQE